MPLQTLSEFYRATTKKGILLPVTARAIVEQYRNVWEVVPPNSEDLTAAMIAHQEHKVQFFDALLWATARRAGRAIFITEDFQDGRILGGVALRNPFTPGFDLDEALRS